MKERLPWVFRGTGFKGYSDGRFDFDPAQASKETKSGNDTYVSKGKSARTRLQVEKTPAHTYVRITYDNGAKVPIVYSDRSVVFEVRSGECVPAYEMTENPSAWISSYDACKGFDDWYRGKPKTQNDSLALPLTLGDVRELGVFAGNMGYSPIDMERYFKSNDLRHFSGEDYATIDPLDPRHIAHDLTVDCASFKPFYAKVPAGKVTPTVFFAEYPETPPLLPLKPLKRLSLRIQEKLYAMGIPRPTAQQIGICPVDVRAAAEMWLARAEARTQMVGINISNCLDKLTGGSTSKIENRVQVDGEPSEHLYGH